MTREMVIAFDELIEDNRQSLGRWWQGMISFELVLEEASLVAT
jgi:hypothetical protein